MRACLKAEVGWCLYRCFSSGGCSPCGGCERATGSNEVLENTQFFKTEKIIYVNGKEKVMLKKEKKSLMQFKNVKNSAAQRIFLFFLKYLI